MEDKDLQELAFNERFLRKAFKGNQVEMQITVRLKLILWHTLAKLNIKLPSLDKNDTSLPIHLAYFCISSYILL